MPRKQCFVCIIVPLRRATLFAPSRAFPPLRTSLAKTRRTVSCSVRIRPLLAYANTLRPICRSSTRRLCGSKAGRAKTTTSGSKRARRGKGTAPAAATVAWYKGAGKMGGGGGGGGRTNPPPAPRPGGGGRPAWRTKPDVTRGITVRSVSWWA